MQINLPWPCFFRFSTSQKCFSFQAKSEKLHVHRERLVRIVGEQVRADRFSIMRKEMSAKHINFHFIIRLVQRTIHSPQTTHITFGLKNMRLQANIKKCLCGCEPSRAGTCVLCQPNFYTIVSGSCGRCGE